MPARNENAFQKRHDTLGEVARRTAHKVSRHIEGQWGMPNAVRFVGGQPFFDANKYYWDVLVPEFKATHKFPDGVLINPPKKAALTIVSALFAPSPIFVPDPRVEPSNAWYTMVMYACWVMHMFMDCGIPKAVHFKNIAYFIEHHPKKDDKWRFTWMDCLCLFMDAHWQYRGPKADTSESD